MVGSWLFGRYFVYLYSSRSESYTRVENIMRDGLKMGNRYVLIMKEAVTDVLYVRSLSHFFELIEILCKNDCAR